MKRRDFITLLGGAVAWPLAAGAQQQPKMLRVGFAGMQPREAPHYANFLKRMAELGYQEGRNFTFDYMQTPNVEGYEKNYRELAARKVDVFLRSGTSRRCVPRFRLPTASRSRSWPSISILLRRVM
jgi:putative tryptophan/tyrosine transport system substrate-binding protein